MTVVPRSTKARSLEEKASRWRLQATSSPNAVAPDPIGSFSVTIDPAVPGAVAAALQLQPAIVGELQSGVARGLAWVE